MVDKWEVSLFDLSTMQLVEQGTVVAPDKETARFVAERQWSGWVCDDGPMTIFVGEYPLMDEAEEQG